VLLAGLRQHLVHVLLQRGRAARAGGGAVAAAARLAALVAVVAAVVAACARPAAPLSPAATSSSWHGSRLPRATSLGCLHERRAAVRTGDAPSTGPRHAARRSAGAAP
jgi:hypothetical protein